MYKKIAIVVGALASAVGLSALPAFAQFDSTSTGAHVDALTATVSDNIGVLIAKYWPALLAVIVILIVWGFGRRILHYFGF